MYVHTDMCSTENKKENTITECLYEKTEGGRFYV